MVRTARPQPSVRRPRYFLQLTLLIDSNTISSAMATPQRYNQYLGSKASITSTTITGITCSFLLDQMAGCCSTLLLSRIRSLPQFTLALVSTSAPMSETPLGATSTTSGSTGKTAEVVETRAGAPPSGITGGVSSEVDTYLRTIIERAHLDIQTCVKSTSSI